MNLHTPDLDREPNREDAEAALALLRRWAGTVSDVEVSDLDPLVSRLIPGQEVSNYPALARAYPEDFAVDDAYKASMPDLQNGPSSLIRGAKQQIQHVGISNFRLPIGFALRGGGSVTLETSVTGTVSLEAEKKGINMSRIMRSFYKKADETFSFEVIEETLDAYKTDLESFDARIQMRFSFPMKVQSLRSGLEGFQYYDIALEVIDSGGIRKKILHLDYVYSSTCPCSLELSEHARQFRGQLATPHSQRSVARLSVEVDCDADCLWFEDLIELCRDAVPTGRPHRRLPRGGVSPREPAQPRRGVRANRRRDLRVRQPRPKAVQHAVSRRVSGRFADVAVISCAFSDGRLMWIVATQWSMVGGYQSIIWRQKKDALCAAETSRHADGFAH